MKKILIISAAGCSLLMALFFAGCAEKHARTDISLEMTDEDSVEAIIDEDLITAGGTIVNIDEEVDAHSAEATVSYVDEVDMQTPTIIEPDESLRPTEETVVEDISYTYDTQPGMMPVDDGLATPVDIQETTSEYESEVSYSTDTDYDSGLSVSTDDGFTSDTDIVSDDEWMTGDTTQPDEGFFDETPITDMTDAELAAEAAEPAEPLYADHSTDVITEPVESTPIDAGTVSTRTGQYVTRTGTETVRPAGARPVGGGYYARVSRQVPVRYPRYTVKAGDTLWSISREKGCSISDLCAANSITRRTILRIGQELIIPTPIVDDKPVGPIGGTAETTTRITPTASTEPSTPSLPEAPQVATVMYTVQEGDSYWKIAKKYSINYMELMALNDTTNPMLHPGDKILVPKE